MWSLREVPCIGDGIDVSESQGSRTIDRPAGRCRWRRRWGCRRAPAAGGRGNLRREAGAQLTGATALGYSNNSDVAVDTHNIYGVDDVPGLSRGADDGRGGQYK